MPNSIISIPQLKHTQTEQMRGFDSEVLQLLFSNCNGHAKWKFDKNADGDLVSMGRAQYSAFLTSSQVTPTLLNYGPHFG